MSDRPYPRCGAVSSYCDWDEGHEGPHEPPYRPLTLEQRGWLEQARIIVATETLCEKPEGGPCSDDRCARCALVAGINYWLIGDATFRARQKKATQEARESETP